MPKMPLVMTSYAPSDDHLCPYCVPKMPLNDTYDFDSIGKQCDLLQDTCNKLIKDAWQKSIDQGINPLDVDWITEFKDGRITMRSNGFRKPPIYFEEE